MMKANTKTLIIIGLTSAATGLVACTSASTQDSLVPLAQVAPVPLDYTQLTGQEWQLNTIDGEPLEKSLGQRQPTLRFDSEMNVSGSLGCNQFFGQVETNEHELRVGKTGITLKRCPDPVMLNERLLGERLELWSGVSLDSGTLTLTQPSGTLNFTAAPQQSDN